MGHTNTARWFLSSDNYVKISNLKDREGVYVNNATVTGVLKDHAGNVLSGGTLNFTPVSGTTTGEYEAVLPASVSLKEGGMYTLYVTVASGGRQGVSRLRGVAKWHELHEEEE